MNTEEIIYDSEVLIPFINKLTTADGSIFDHTHCYGLIIKFLEDNNLKTNNEISKIK